MGVGFFCQWEIIFLSGEKSFGLVGEVAGIVLFTYPDYRLCAEVGLFDLMTGEKLVVFRRGRDKKFTFDFHNYFLSGSCIWVEFSELKILYNTEVIVDLADLEYEVSAESVIVCARQEQ